MTRFPSHYQPDLTQAMVLAADSIVAHMDESAGFRPCFYIKGRDGVPATLGHGSWDLGDMTGRYLESMIMVRHMVGATDDWSAAEQRLRAFLESLFGPSGLVMDIDKDAPDHMFAQGSALYGLVKLFEDGRDVGIQARIESFIRSLLAHATVVEDYVIYPDCATASASCSHMAGYQIFPVMRFYELTGFQPALELAEGLSKWAFHHDDTITPDGIVTRIGWEGHLHAWMDTLSGVMRCARVSPHLDRGLVVERCRKTYDWVRANCATAFGWVPDFPTSPSSETCAISSMMRLALELIAEGYDSYWNDVERFLHNQLLENQFRDVDHLGIADPRVAAAVSGSFDCWAKPNTLFANVRQWGKEDDGDIEGCCVNGGMRGIYMAWHDAITRVDDVVSVNLLIDRSTPDVIVQSSLPAEGVVSITARRPVVCRMRLPDWVDANEVEVTAGAERSAVSYDGGWLMLGALVPHLPVEVRFPVRHLSETVTVASDPYQIEWQGDTVVTVKPEGGRYPIYQRQPESDPVQARV
jgi:hypothetical protein